MTLPGFVFDLPDPALIWGLFQRALGLLLGWAIIQLYHQVLPLAGTRGMQPVAQKLVCIQTDYPGWRGWLYFPTLLWLNVSDRFLKGWLLLGAGAAVVAVYGGPWSGWALLVCWLVYLSYDLAVGLTYPWDSLLLEAGFLGLFLPQLPVLPHWGATSLPLPIVAWAYRWLFFRVLFGFGKYKFIGGSLRDTGYFRSFLVNIPLPTYAAWFMYRLPRWVFQAIILLVFLTEVVLSFGVFITGETRLIVACTTIILMLGVQLVSNFGFFNILTIVLCLPLLDLNASLFDTTGSLVASSGVTYGIITVLAIGGLLHLPFNSWCTLTWLHWPSLVRIPGLQPVLAFYRVLLRFRVVNAYGVFPPTSSPPIRWVPVIEGSRNGIDWLPYEYRYMTTTEATPPRFVAPYHPRFDHGIFYESFGTNDANFAWSTIGSGNPYDFSHTTGLECLVQRLLEGEPTVLTVFRHCPFPADAPPLSVRVTLYRFQPTTPAQRRQTGHWWVRKAVGTHLPPSSRNERVWERRATYADLFHPDAIHWKRRAPWLKTLMALAREGRADALQQALASNLPLSPDVFWTEFVPWMQATGINWNTLPGTVSRFHDRFDSSQRLTFERLLSRLSLVMLTKLEPHFFGTAKPPLPVSEYFQLTLFTHHLMAKGQSVYQGVFQQPVHAIDHLADFQPEQSFCWLALFWFDTLVFQARKFRIVMQISAVQWGNGLPGFLELVPFISQQFAQPGDEHLPLMARNPANGEWSVAEPDSIVTPLPS